MTGLTTLHGRLPHTLDYFLMAVDSALLIVASCRSYTILQTAPQEKSRDDQENAQGGDGPIPLNKFVSKRAKSIETWRELAAIPFDGEPIVQQNREGPWPLARWRCPANCADLLWTGSAGTLAGWDPSAAYRIVAKLHNVMHGRG
jgi:hypothetical protein